MAYIINHTVPFLTRFFRAWADDVRVPDKDPPRNERTSNDLNDLERNGQK